MAEFLRAWRGLPGAVRAAIVAATAASAALLVAWQRCGVASDFLPSGSLSL